MRQCFFPRLSSQSCFLPLRPLSTIATLLIRAALRTLYPGPYKDCGRTRLVSFFWAFPFLFRPPRFSFSKPREARRTPFFCQNAPLGLFFLFHVLNYLFAVFAAPVTTGFSGHAFSPKGESLFRMTRFFFPVVNYMAFLTARGSS